MAFADVCGLVRVRRFQSVLVSPEALLKNFNLKKLDTCWAQRKSGCSREVVRHLKPPPSSGGFHGDPGEVTSAGCCALTDTYRSQGAGSPWSRPRRHRAQISRPQLSVPGFIMNVFDRNINFDALFKFSQISHSTQVHLKNVYSSLAVCMLLAAAGSYVHVVTRLFQGGVLSVLGSLAMMSWLAMTPHGPQTERRRLAILAGFAFLTGVGLGPTLDFVITVNPSIVTTAFMGTAVIFICFSLSALYAKRRSYLFLGGTLMSGLSALFLVSVVNMLVGSVMLFKAHMYLGLLVMCGFVLFDTQLIIEKAENGDKDYVWHCVDLFLDFITIFRKLMVILTLNEKDKKKEKK